MGSLKRLCLRGADSQRVPLLMHLVEVFPSLEELRVNGIPGLKRACDAASCSPPCGPSGPFTHRVAVCFADFAALVALKQLRVLEARCNVYISPAEVQCWLHLRRCNLLVDYVADWLCLLDAGRRAA